LAVEKRISILCNFVEIRFSFSALRVQNDERNEKLKQIVLLNFNIKMLLKRELFLLKMNFYEMI